VPKFVADSVETTGLKWVAPSSGALTLIKRASFTSVADTGTTFDNVFTSTYVNYMLSFEFVSAATLANDMHMQLRTTGPTTRTTSYGSSNLRYAEGSTTQTLMDDASFWILAENTYGGGTLFYNLTNTHLSGFYYSENNSAFSVIQARNGAGAGGVMGFLLKSSSSNITGTVAVYGMAKS
jgi:hypothetical protein